jgi:hypothetical protein
LEVDKYRPPSINEVVDWILWEHTARWRISFKITRYIFWERWRNRPQSINEIAAWIL